MIQHLRRRGPGLRPRSRRYRAHAPAIGGELVRDRREGLVERHVGVDDQRRRLAVGEQREREGVGAARLDGDPPRGRRSNSRSVDAASGAFAAHSMAIRASCSRPPGPATLPSSASRAARHHAARSAGARADAARASSRAVVATRVAACSKPRRSRRIHSVPQRSRASNCVATSVSSAASKLLAIIRGLRPERRGEGARRLDARHPGAETRERTPGRREQLDERQQHHDIAPRDRFLSCPIGAGSSDIKSQRFGWSHRRKRSAGRSRRRASRGVSSS